MYAGTRSPQRNQANSSLLLGCSFLGLSTNSLALRLTSLEPTLSGQHGLRCLTREGGSCNVLHACAPAVGPRGIYPAQRHPQLLTALTKLTDVCQVQIPMHSWQSAPRAGWFCWVSRFLVASLARSATENPDLNRRGARDIGLRCIPSVSRRASKSGTYCRAGSLS